MATPVFSHVLSRMLRCHRAAAWALAVVLALAAGPALAQTRGTWNVDADGTWSVTTNWLNNTVAGGVSGTANFTNNITATRTVSLDTNRSLGSFIFGDSDTTSVASWIVAPVTGGTTMTMANGTNSPTITVNALGTGATATISVVLASSTSPAIVKDGVGTLVLSAQQYLCQAGYQRGNPAGQHRPQSGSCARAPLRLIKSRFRMAPLCEQVRPSP